MDDLTRAMKSGDQNMVVRIKNFLRGRVRNRLKPVYDPYAWISKGSGTVLAQGFQADVRGGNKEGRIVVGQDSVLQCSITLERDTGNVTIGDNTFIGASHLVCAYHVDIGSDVLIAWGCTVVDHNSHSLHWSERSEDVKRWRQGMLNSPSAAAALKNWNVVPMESIIIGNQAWIGFNAIILKGVTIGQGAVIGAGSVVTKDVPSWTIVAGNPARVIREIPDEER